MHPGALIAPASQTGFPAPYWFLVLFKVIGFVLHTALMNLWFAGPILALILYWRGGHPRTITSRLMQKMPIIIAYGINFGIIPLLFIQVAYYQVFYPSSILMAWPWLSIIVLLTFAYYGIYIYATALKASGSKMGSFRRVAGWTAAIFFIIIGFIFSNEFSLMTNIAGWPAIWKDSNFGGAVLGIGLNLSDPTLWPRWLMMFGLAIMTTSAFFGVDTGLFAGRESEEYRHWAARFAFKPYIAGVIWYGICALWYIFGTWQNDIQKLMLSGPDLVLTVVTALSPLLPLIILIYCARKRQVTKAIGILLGLSQVIVIACNAISRQVVQNAELGRFINISAGKVRTQLSPLILFLLIFAGGVVLLIWMIHQAVISGRAGTESSDAA